MKVLKLPENRVGRDFVTGDIHGSYVRLHQALEEVGFDYGTDRLICTGDLIDRGKASFKCLRLLWEPWFYSVRGNHESMMLLGLKDSQQNLDFRLWLQSGGGWALQHDRSELAAEAMAASERLPYAIEVPVRGQIFGIIHAEVPTEDWAMLDRALDTEIARETALWSRSNIKQVLSQDLKEPRFISNIDLVFVGHTPLAEPVRLGNVCYIDTAGFEPRGRHTIIDLASSANAVPMAIPGSIQPFDFS